MHEILESPTHFNIVLEFMNGGTLNSYLTDQKEKRLSEEDVKKVVYQVLLGLNYLHNLGIVHRDMKPPNILLKYKNDLNSIKIADLGFATYFDTEKGMS